jgi:hypothetical protein
MISAAAAAERNEMKKEIKRYLSDTIKLMSEIGCLFQYKKLHGIKFMIRCFSLEKCHLANCLELFPIHFAPGA